MISLSRPCLIALREERALPSGVLGPPDLAPFSREERIRRSEDIGDFPPGRILVREVEAGRRGFWRNDLDSMGWREWKRCDRNGTRASGGSEAGVQEWLWPQNPHRQLA